MQIQINEFCLPRGQRRVIFGEVSDDCKEGYEALTKAGCRITGEVLRTGFVSVTIEEPSLGDYDIQVIKNRPTVIAVLETMIKKFNLIEFEEWKKKQYERIQR
jgi:hypothetical protein